MFKRLLAIFALIIWGTYCSYNIYNWQVVKASPDSSVIGQQQIEHKRVETVTLTAAGDILMHGPRFVQVCSLMAPTVLRDFFAK